MSTSITSFLLFSFPWHKQTWKCYHGKFNQLLFFFDDKGLFLPYFFLLLFCTFLSDRPYRKHEVQTFYWTIEHVFHRFFDGKIWIWWGFQNPWFGHGSKSLVVKYYSLSQHAVVRRYPTWAIYARSSRGYFRKMHIPQVSLQTSLIFQQTVSLANGLYLIFFCWDLMDATWERKTSLSI